jgi:hypothetical protein
MGEEGNPRRARGGCGIRVVTGKTDLGLIIGATSYGRPGTERVGQVRGRLDDGHLRTI